MHFVRRWTLALLAGSLTLMLSAGCTASNNAGQAEERRPDASSNSASLDEITDEDIEQSPAETNLQELLEGRVAGVQVLQQGNGIAVRIRGTSSINGSNEPLYVVDGVPLTTGPGGVLAINPYDVKSIEVLKRASETAYYGVRGANGVILVTTKRGDDR